MKQKFIFKVEIYPMIEHRSLCVQQLLPDYKHGYIEEVVVTARDFSEASALLSRRFFGFINKYNVRSMVSEVIK